VRRPVVTQNVGTNSTASQSQLYVNNILLCSWQHVLTFNYQPSSDTDTTTWRKYTHIQRIIVKPTKISNLHCSQMLVLLKRQNCICWKLTYITIHYKCCCSTSVKCLVRVILLRVWLTQSNVGASEGWYNSCVINIIMLYMFNADVNCYKQEISSFWLQHSVWCHHTTQISTTTQQ
jgi:hypothetical protein